MPNCYICDKGMDEVHLDNRDMKPKPCSECETIIQETVDGYQRLDEKDDEDDCDITYVETELVEFDEEVHSSLTDLDDA